MLATARRVEAQTVTHPLNPVLRDLVSRARATAVPLDRVAPDDIAALLAQRFPDHAFPPELLATLDRITAGTPLFLVSVLDDLVAREMIVHRDGRWVLAASIDDVRAHRPSNVEQLIDIRIDRLEPAEQRVLEAAAVIGAEFSSGLVAAALELSAEEVDEVCDGLARRSLFLRRHDGGEPWPDGTLHPHYAVTHALVQQVCLARSAPARRQRWHRLVAEQLERAYGSRAEEVAHALAMHFERAGAIPRAVQHYVLAAERTAARFASPDALVLFRRARELLARVPAGLERDRHELRTLAGIVASTLRTADPSEREPSELLERIIVLARATDDAPRLCAALLNLAFRTQLVADHRRGLEIFAQVDAVIASAALHPALAQFAGAMSALNRMWLGQLDGVARVFEDILAAPGVLEEPALEILGPTDRRTVVTGYLATVRCLTGDHAGALAEAERALVRATHTNDPFGLGLTRCTLAWIRLVAGEPRDRIREAAQPVLALDGAELWRHTVEVLCACADPVDAAAAERLLAELRSRAPAIPFGTTRLGVAALHMLRAAGLFERAAEVAAELRAFAETHAEHVVDTLLTA